MHDELLTNKIALHLSNGAYHRTVYMTVACKVKITSVSQLHSFEKLTITNQMNLDPLQRRLFSKPPIRIDKLLELRSYYNGTM